MKSYRFTMTMRDFGRFFFKNKYKIVIFGVVGLLIALYFSQFTKSEYEAQTDLLIDSNNEEEMNNTLQMMPTYKDLLFSSIILDSVRNKFSHNIEIKELKQMLDVETSEMSQLMTIYVTSNQKKEAIQLTNLFAESLKEEIEKHFKKTNVKILNKATSTSKTNQTVIVAVFSTIGFLLFALAMYAMVLAIEVYRPKIDTAEKVEFLGQTPLVTISKVKKLSGGEQVNLDNGDFVLLASLLHNDLRNYPLSNLLIKRDVKQENAAFGVAKSYELLNKKVLVIQLNSETEQQELAHQKWNSYVNREESIGNLITRKAGQVDTLIVDYSEKLDTMPMNRLLFDRLHEELQQQYDVLLFTTDIMNKHYTFVLSQLIDHSIYIVNSKKTSLEQADKDLVKIDKMNLEILGTVLVQ